MYNTTYQKLMHTFYYIAGNTEREKWKIKQAVGGFLYVFLLEIDGIVGEKWTLYYLNELKNSENLAQLKLNREKRSM